MRRVIPSHVMVALSLGIDAPATIHVRLPDGSNLALYLTPEQWKDVVHAAIMDTHVNLEAKKKGGDY